MIIMITRINGDGVAAAYYAVVDRDHDDGGGGNENLEGRDIS
jgi:hypothetical protein